MKLPLRREDVEAWLRVPLDPDPERDRRLRIALLRREEERLGDGTPPHLTALRELLETERDAAVILDLLMGG